MLSIRNLTCSFKKGQAIKYPDWEVPTGGRAVILGASGSGKTTLLHLLSGLRQPTEGTVTIGQTRLDQLSPAKLDAFRGRNIGFVFQKPHLVPSLSVMENIKVAGYLAGAALPPGRVDSLMGRLGIADLADRKPHAISQGQAQRVGLARAVANGPKVIFADEPTASLDDKNCQVAIDLLFQEATVNEATLIIATHDRRVKDKFSSQLSL